MNFAAALQGIVALLWLLVFGLIALAVVRASRRQPVRAFTPAILGLALLAVLMTSVSAGLVFIQPEERGVVISAAQKQGYRSDALTPGLHWIVPFLENVVTYPISKETYTMSKTATEGQVQGDDAITARTLDGQEVFIDASVIYAIDPNQVVNVHIAWQNRYSGDLVRPLARGAIRDAVSQFRVEEVVSTKRAEMASEITDKLKQQLSSNGINLVDFILRNITFSPEYAASVEQKQIAEQQAQQAKFVVESKKQEAEQARQVAQGQADASVINAKGAADARLIQADAEAKALNLIAQSLQDNPDLLTYNYINKIAPGVQVMLVPNNSPFLLPLPTVGAPVTTADNPASLLPPQPTPLPTTIAPSPTPAPTPTAKP
jgi:regulator of protease activity HflC (stomatin/prohibitin superfamily)